MSPAATAHPGNDENGVRDVVTQGDEYLRPRQEQAKDRALDPSETAGAATAPDEAQLPGLTPTSGTVSPSSAAKPS